MDFTRQPIIQTVITAKEGCKLVIRSSKSAGQEEYFVDAIEVVSFGNTFFFRSQEKPKSFLVPASDYEVLEVREARMVLKNVGMNRSIKIGGGKEKAAKEPEKAPEKQQKEEEQEAQSPTRQTERKRDRRRSFRRRKRGEEQGEGTSEEQVVTDVPLIPPPPMAKEPIKLPEPRSEVGGEDLELSSAVLKSLLPPPPNLISDTIEKYKDNKLFEGVFVGSSVKKEETAEVSSEIETFEEIEQVIEEEGCFPECFDEPEQFTEEQEEQIMEQRQKLQEEDDPLMGQPFNDEDPFLQDPPPPLHDEQIEDDLRNDEVSSKNNGS